MNLNIPPYNPHQANTASLNPTHIQHLTQSQYMPSCMSHPCQTTTPHIQPERSLPQHKDNAETPTQPPVFLEQMKVLKQLMTDMQHAQNHEPGMVSATPTIITTVTPPPHMYSFILLNIARLFTKTKSKYKVLYDLCSLSTLFICLCETFLTEDISDSEIQIPEFSIVRCERHLRGGGGVCIYVRTTNPFHVCVKYLNSICDLLIINLPHSSLIIIMMYRPPSCPAIEFNDIIQKAKCYIMSWPSPLPNIIMLGDINLPNIDWSCPDISCPIASPFN